MDQAKRGATALEAGDFTGAISHYTDALQLMPQAVDYYIKRSTAYTRVSPPDPENAFKDSEIAVALATKRAKRELIASAQLRRAVALFGLERYADSRKCLRWVKQLNEKEKSLPIWEMKITAKLKDVPEDDEKQKSTIKELPEIELPSLDTKKPDNKGLPKPLTESNTTMNGNGSEATPTNAVQTPASKIRHEWYQQNDSIIVSLFARGIPKEKAMVDIKPSSLSVSFPLPTGSDYDFSLDPLFANIDPVNSSYKIMSTKAEFNLKKATPGQKWHTIEGTRPVDDAIDMSAGANDDVKKAILADHKPDVGPVYPTSSKSGPKNWDKLATDLTKKPKIEDGEEDDGGYDDEGGDPVNSFFSTLYKGADDDTKRAMMKSYQESNGTALSTNWSEVKKGKVETTPPDGMEAKKWGD